MRRARAVRCTWATRAPPCSRGCGRAAKAAGSCCASRIWTPTARGRCSPSASSRISRRSASTGTATRSGSRDAAACTRARSRPSRRLGWCIPASARAPTCARRPSRRTARAGAAYPGTCRVLAPDEVSSRLAAGRRASLRFRSEDGLDDYVLRRSDGVFGYQLAVVVDDADQGVNHVLRGDDLAASTPRQIELWRALELGPPPRYLHVPARARPGGQAPRQAPRVARDAIGARGRDVAGAARRAGSHGAPASSRVPPPCGLATSSGRSERTL